MLQSFANINVLLQSILDTKYCSTTLQFRIEYIFGGKKFLWTLDYVQTK